MTAIAERKSHTVTETQSPVNEVGTAANPACWAGYLRWQAAVAVRKEPIGRDFDRFFGVPPCEG